MAQQEHALGIRSSYYFRYPGTFRPDIIRKIRDLGHEIGYHYEVLSKTNGDYAKAIALFSEELEEFRKICPVKTICMHGSPLSKYNNRDLWERYDYHAYGIFGEAFLSFGTVNSATVIKDRYTGQSRGFGFVEMEASSQAQTAIKGLNGKEIMGKEISVSEARPRRDEGRTGGGRMDYRGGGNRY